jgi:hypothetical protein
MAESKHSPMHAPLCVLAGGGGTLSSRPGFGRLWHAAHAVPQLGHPAVESQLRTAVPYLLPWQVRGWRGLPCTDETLPHPLLMAGAAVPGHDTEDVAAAATLTQLARLELTAAYHPNLSLSSLSTLTGLQSLSLMQLNLPAGGLSLVAQGCSSLTQLEFANPPSSAGRIPWPLRPPAAGLRCWSCVCIVCSQGWSAMCSHSSPDRAQHPCWPVLPVQLPTLPGGPVRCTRVPGGCRQHGSSSSWQRQRSWQQTCAA